MPALLSARRLVARSSRLRKLRDFVERLYPPLYYWLLLLAVWDVLFNVRIPG